MYNFILAADPSAVADPQRTRFFTGNNALDAGLAGAALGVASQYLANQIFNPCRSNRNRNRNRINGQTIQNGLLGFVAGYAGASLLHNAAGRPCGR